MATVLIADDDVRIRRLLGMTLRGVGHEVLEADDGDAALAALHAHRPAVAVLDVQMPGRSGLDVCRALRADPALASIRVLIVSANAVADDVEGAGADAFLPKPFSPLRLLAAVDALAGEALRGAGQRGR